MPAHARRIIDGQLRCSKCKQPRPLWWFAKDKHASPLFVTYRCLLCRQSDNRIKLVDPDWEVIDVSKITLIPQSAVKMVPGSWERVVQRAIISTPRECVVVWVGKNYFDHHAAYTGIMMAAQRLKVRVNIQHGWTELYVTKAAQSGR